MKKIKSFIRTLNKMGPNAEPCGIPIKVFEKDSQCNLFVHLNFYVLSMNAQKLLHPLLNHALEGLKQVNDEEYSEKPWRYP